MELIEVELTEFTHRSRSLSVAHASTDLVRGLEYGERVVVLSGTDYRTAVVADIDFTAEDTHYRLVLGGRVAKGVVEGGLLGDIDARPRAPRLSVEDVADLLARSGAAHRIPMQRSVARRLQQR